MIVEIDPKNIDQRKINIVVDALRNGSMIIIPTDAVYAVAVDLKNTKGLQALANFKNEKLSKLKFSVLIDDFTMLSNYVGTINRSLFRILKNHLPGPFTFIIPCNDNVPKLFSSKRKSIGIRMPNHEVVKHIIRELGNGLAVASLHNLDDEIQNYYTDPDPMISDYMDIIPMIINSGNGNLEPSTVVDCTDEPKILRQGLGELNVR